MSLLIITVLGIVNQFQKYYLFINLIREGTFALKKNAIREFNISKKVILMTF